MGSWRSTDTVWGLRGEKAQFDEACKELGAELARRRQLIIVGGQSENTADNHVVSGYESVIGNSAQEPLIEVIRPDNDVQAYHENSNRFQGLFSFPPSNQHRWGDTHLMQISDADAVLIVGGMGGTYQAGLAAIVAKKRLVPVGSFGGAAARLLKSLHERRVPYTSDLNILHGPWNPHTLDTTIRLLGVDRQPRILVIHGHSDDRYKLTDWLRTTLGLNDLLVMRQEFGGGQTLPEKFESLAAQADGAIAIATPDDVGGVAGTAEQGMRARQNVWLEVGWIWGRLGRNKVMVLSKGSLEMPSDLNGIEHYRYDTSPIEATEKIRKFVETLRDGA